MAATEAWQHRRQYGPGPGAVLCRMHAPMTETDPLRPAAAPVARAPRTWRMRAPRLGIGWRLVLGLAAVAAVLLVGEVLATRTARQALEAVRSMQNEHEPLASSASAVLERLVTFDRVVGEYVRAHNPGDFNTITSAGDELERAVADYFRSVPPSSVPESAADLRAQLSRHIALARQLAIRAAQREQRADERQAALTRVY